MIIYAFPDNVLPSSLLCLTSNTSLWCLINSYSVRVGIDISVDHYMTARGRGAEHMFMELHNFKNGVSNYPSESLSA